MQQKYVSHYMAQKAGMKDIDKKSIAQKMEQILANTPKTLHQKELNDRRNIQIAEMKRKMNQFTSQQRQDINKEWFQIIKEYRSNRVLTRIWAHLDFDMFYVACQLLSRPQLKGFPCAVGGPNSVLCTANYEARKYGVRSALPTFIAMQLCPQLHLFAPDFTKYKHYSNIFRQILSKYDSQFESHGLDQAYVDMTPHLIGKSKEEVSGIISSLREQIYGATGLTVSCGVGANKMLAKLTSEERKPNDQFILQNNQSQIEAYMESKAIRKIPGIGPVNEYYLKGLGIEQGKDILKHTGILSLCFTKPTAEFFVAAALGIGAIDHDHQERKSVGKSETFRPTDDPNFIQDKLKSLCQELEQEMEELGFLSNNVVLGYQTENYQKKDKSFKLPMYSSSQKQFFNICISHLRGLKFKIRLLGVRCSVLIKSQDYLKNQLLDFLKNKGKKEVGVIQSIRAEIAKIGTHICPVCNAKIECKGKLSILNKHIDKCLLGETIQPQKTQKQQEIKRPPSPKATSFNRQYQTSKTKKQQKKKKNQNLPSILTFIKKQ